MYTDVKNDITGFGRQSVNYYVLMVATGREEKFIAFARKLIAGAENHVLCPKRLLMITRRGESKEVKKALFPGYVFWATTELADEVVTAIRRLPEFFKFLRADGKIAPITGTEKKVLVDLMGQGDEIPRSTVVFDENNLIRVIEGPLRHFEGKILKVDRRKGRARVAISLHGNVMEVDLGFEVMKQAE